MKIQVCEEPLLKYLEKKSPQYYCKAAFELRDRVEAWLAYTTESFPHYTRHTIEHSEQIIHNLSKLLFRASSFEEPVIKLSGVETYILIAAAYLHDAGMVVSNDEKIKILASQEWKNWIETSVNERWSQIEAFRVGSEPANEAVKNFIADLHTRYLIAEFVRRRHHLRAGQLVIELHDGFAQFAFNDPILLTAISNVCIAHGLAHKDLEDNTTFPFERDILNETANLRLLAILLRLGDLLDMSAERACPLLLKAAGPLPPDSNGHWTQYHKIVHRLTSPEKIEITAECDNLEEHRILRNWCQWIVDEVEYSYKLLARSTRHTDWQPPEAKLDGDLATISIKPKAAAKYIPVDWRFKLDTDVIFQRLIKDVYGDPDDFLRELLQNALDANRCQMLRDMKTQNLPVPTYPNQAPKEIREQYPIKLEIGHRQIFNSISQQNETRCVLTIEDAGIGMDREIIEDYFLQIGRSFYTTTSFRQEFKFAPSNRFGLGFLSVFNVSRCIEIDTYKPSSIHNDGPLHLRLDGPRDYLLIEKGTLKESGTKIAIVLDQDWETGKLSNLVAHWLKKVEFPIFVQDFGKNYIVEDHLVDFIEKRSIDIEGKAKIFIKEFPVECNGIFGKVFIRVYMDGSGEETWEPFNYIWEYEKKYHVQVPKLPLAYTCQNGMTIDVGSIGLSFSFAVDIRKPLENINLDKSSIKNKNIIYDIDLRKCIIGIVKEHLAQPRFVKEDDVFYKQHLANDFKFDELWIDEPKTIKAYLGKSVIFCSLSELEKQEKIYTLHTSWNRKKGKVTFQSLNINNIHKSKSYTLLQDDLIYFSSYFLKKIFNQRFLEQVINEEGMIKLVWSLESNENLFFSRQNEYHYIDRYFLEYDDPDVALIYAEVGKMVTVLNKNNDFIKWYLKLVDWAETSKEISVLDIEKILDEFINLGINLFDYNSNISEFKEYLVNWHKVYLLPEELQNKKPQILRSQFLRLGNL